MFMLASRRMTGMVTPARMTSLTARLTMKRLVALFWLSGFRHVTTTTMTLAKTAMMHTIPMVAATPCESTPSEDDVIFGREIVFGELCIL